MKNTSAKLNLALCALFASSISLHGANAGIDTATVTSAPVPTAARGAIAGTASRTFAAAKTLVQGLVSDAKQFGGDFITDLSASMVASWATNGAINMYYDKKGYLAVGNNLLYEVRDLHTEVLAALRDQITSLQQQAFADRLQVIMDQVPRVSWLYRYLFGLTLHVALMTALNKVVNRCNASNRCQWAAPFTQHFSDTMIENFAKDSDETWSSVLAQLETEINALYRLIRDLPCCDVARSR